MPMYEYLCERCGHRFDEIKRIAERDHPETCPECGATATAQISGVAMLTGSSKGYCAPSGGG